MKRIELELEHRYMNRYVGRHRLRAEEGVAFLGSAREAHVRLVGENICGVHALLEFRGDGWVICDMGSEQGTWVRKQPIVEHYLTGTTQIHIGGHVLKATPREIDSDLFSLESKPRSSVQGVDLFHQVVVRRRGVIVESALLESTEPFVFYHGGKTHHISAPREQSWTVHNYSQDVMVQQRLVKTQILEATPSEKVKALWDPNLRAPILASVTLFVLFLLLMLFAPQKSLEDFTALQPDENRFTRLIYDASAVQKQRDRAQQLRQHIDGQTTRTAEVRPQATGTPAEQQGTAEGASQAAAQVVNNIQAAGLSQLVGRISQRAANQAAFVQAAGERSDRQVGRALATVGSTSTEAIQEGPAGAHQGHRVAGVGTVGRGGGQESVQGVGGLSMGNVGNASVGIIEEETEVQGGLDREVIAQVIQGYLGQIRYCYERQLSANPELYGKVQVRFTIGGTGSVTAQQIGTTSLRNAMVEGCILRRIASWQFPAPKGGTLVNVTYPFLFQSTM